MTKPAIGRPRPGDAGGLPRTRWRRQVRSIKVHVIVNHSPIEGSAILTKPTDKALDKDLLERSVIKLWRRENVNIGQRNDPPR
jgi:hypothetical protein